MIRLFIQGSAHVVKIKMALAMLFACVAYGQGDIQRNELEKAVIDFLRKVTWSRDGVSP